MKKLLLLSASASLLSSAAWLQASPLFSVGDNVDVFFDGSSNLRWSSNLFNDESGEVDDLLLTLTPGFEVDFVRGESNVDLSLLARYDLLRYHDHNEVDTELAHVKAKGSYEAARLDLTASASFDESQTASSQGQNLPGQLFESEATRVGLEGEYQLSPKFSFGAGVNYYDTKYVSANTVGAFADREEVSVPVDVYYELTPKLDLSLGYSRVEAEVGAAGSAAYDQVTNFYSLGARGELLPKLSGFLKLGYRENEFTNKGMFGADLDFSYAVTQKLNSSLALSRDFGVGGAGDSTENSSIKLRADYSIDEQYSVSANLGYDLRDYQSSDREDDQYSAGVRLDYVLDENWRLSTGYTYSENDSSLALSSYVNHALNLSASLRY
ncbi:MAG TPA: hypothetical protein DD423_03195 [Opitutae bacterium]|nr:hypothetical protein [Opitutae bacterium]